MVSPTISVPHNIAKIQKKKNEKLHIHKSGQWMHANVGQNLQSTRLNILITPIV